LKTSGLLVTLTRQDHLAVLPADNTLNLGIEHRVYTGDMYGPGTAVQLTPWTRPSIHGYTTYPDGVTLHDGYFQAIDNIHYLHGDHGDIAFDYIKDIRKHPIIREDSWIGPETTRYDFSSDVVVTNTSVLTLDTWLDFSSTLRIEEGSSVIINAGGHIVLKGDGFLDMADNTRLIVRGTLVLNGSVRRGHQAEIVQEGKGVVHSNEIRRRPGSRGEWEPARALSKQ
jgi:hypothetical protein